MVQPTYPKETKAIVLEKAAEGGPLVYNAVLKTLPVPELKEGEVLVRMAAAGFNHREVWQRKNMYPATTEGAIMGCDGAGVVVAAHDPNDSFLQQKVMFVPTRGWESDVRGPEGRFAVYGGIPAGGTFTEFAVVERHNVIPVPSHLPLVYAAAWPCGGVTAWRTVTINGQVQAGDNVLITGIGGGVALIALQLCVALGANVYVTSSNPAKLQKAGDLGARGGVSYKAENWPKLLGELLQQAGGKRTFDAVIDSAGGDIIGQLGRLLSNGARIMSYGMTVAPEIKLRMTDVLRGIQLKGSTMGSREDFIAATDFIAQHQIVPEVSHVLRGLEDAQEGFNIIAGGEQMGKVVIKFPGREADGDVRL